MKISAYENGSNALCLLDLPSFRARNLSINLKHSKNINISCIEDQNLHATPYKCEIGAASFVLALLAKLAANDEFIGLDEGYLSAESCLGEEEAGEILSFLKEAKFLIFDENLKKHKDFENIAFFMNFLCEKFHLKCVCSDEKECQIEINKFKNLKELDNFDGLVLCNANSDKIIASRQFLQIAKVQNNDEVEVKFKDFKIKSKIILDENLQGTVGFLDLAKAGYKDFGFVKINLKRMQNAC